MTNSRTYRSQKVQSVQVEAMVAGREGQPAVVGVDVGKKELFLAVKRPDGHAEWPVMAQSELPAAMECVTRHISMVGVGGGPFYYCCDI